MNILYTVVRHDLTDKEQVPVSVRDQNSIVQSCHFSCEASCETTDETLVA